MNSKKITLDYLKYLNETWNKVIENEVDSI